MFRYSGKIRGQMQKGSCISMNKVMVRRRCFHEMGGFNEMERLAEDYGLRLRYCTLYRFLYFAEFFAYYRVVENQISSNKDSSFWANQRTLKDFFRNFPNVVSRSCYRKAWSAFYARHARYNFGISRYGSALKNVILSTDYWPFNSVAWRCWYRVFFPFRFQ